MDDKNFNTGLPESFENPAFPDITSDPLNSSGGSFPEIGSGFSSDPLGSSGSSFPEIGSGFDSDPLGSTGMNDFPEISTDDFASISIDDTITPPEQDTVPDTSVFPDVTKEPHDNGIPDPVPPPPVTVTPMPNPTVSSIPKQAVQEEEEDFAGDHYTWNGKSYVETDTPSASYTQPGAPVPPSSQSYGQNTSGSANYNQPKISIPVTPQGQSAKSIRTLGILSIVMTFISCCGCSPISLFLAIITLVKASKLKGNGTDLTPEEQNCVKTGTVTAIVALVIIAVSILIEAMAFVFQIV